MTENERGFAGQSLELLRLMFGGKLRRAMHYAAGNEGDRGWYLLSLFQVPVPLSLAVIRYDLLEMEESIFQSVIRTGVIWLELFSLLLVLMTAAALLTRTGMTGRTAASLVFVACIPMSLMLLAAALLSMFFNFLSLPLLVTGLCVALVLLYMGFESACIAAKKNGFFVFFLALFLFVTVCCLLVPQLL